MDATRTETDEGSGEADLVCRVSPAAIRTLPGVRERSARGEPDARRRGGPAFSGRSGHASAVRPSSTRCTQRSLGATRRGVPTGGAVRMNRVPEGVANGEHKSMGTDIHQRRVDAGELAAVAGTELAAADGGCPRGSVDARCLVRRPLRLRLIGTGCVSDSVHREEQRGQFARTSDPPGPDAITAAPRGGALWPRRVAGGAASVGGRKREEL